MFSDDFLTLGSKSSGKSVTVCTKCYGCSGCVGCTGCKGTSKVF